MKKTLAMLLAGGRAKGYNVLTHQRVKAAIPFAGIYRIIDFTLSNLMHSEIHNVGILTQYKPSSLMDHVGRGLPWDYVGRNRSIKLLPPYQGVNENDWYRGSSDAVYQNLDYINDYNPERILMLSAEHIYSMDYTQLVKFHIENKADCTAVVKKMPLSKCSQFGNLTFDEKGYVSKFEEKPKKPKTEWAALGIYLFNTDILLKRLKENNKKNKSFEFGRDIVPMMVEKGDKVLAWVFDDFWAYMKDASEYWKTNMLLLEKDSPIDLLKWDIHTNLEDRSTGDRPPAEFGRTADVSRSLISPGCVIYGKVHNSILSPGVIVEKNAAIYDSVIMHDCYIKSGAVVFHSILDKGIEIGTNSYIGYGTKLKENKEFADSIHSGLSLIGKNAIIPESTQIGKNCVVFPNITKKNFKKQIIISGKTIK